MRRTKPPGPNDGNQPVPETPPEDVTLSAVEERLSVGIEQEETSAVRVQTVNREEMTEIPLTMRTQSVEVERIPINRPVEAEYEPRREGDTLVVPVFEYIPVTEMRLMLKEEVRIRTRRKDIDVVHQVLVQRQALVVERRDNATGDWVAQELPSTAARENGGDDLP
jgi:stress response protein YsnF